MRSRALIHKNKIEDFKSFLESKNFTIYPPNGCYEVFRARKESEKLSTLLIFHQRHDSDHITTWGDGLKWARKFIDVRRSLNAKN